MKTSKTMAVGTAILMLAAFGVNAKNDDTGKRKGEFAKMGEIKAYRAKQRKSIREFKEKRREDNKTFRESLKDKEPMALLNAIIANRKSKYAETKTFMDGKYNDFVSYVKEIIAKKEVPEEKQSAFLSKIDDRYKEAVEKHEEMFKKLITALEELKSKDDLTKEDIKKTFSELQPDRKDSHSRRKGKGKREISF